MLKFSRHNGAYVQIFATKWRVCSNFRDKMARMFKFSRQNGLFMGFVLEDTILKGFSKMPLKGPYFRTRSLKVPFRLFGTLFIVSH